MARNTALLSAQTSNGSGSPATWNGGGVGTVFVYGTWDSAQVDIEVSPDGSTWVALGGDMAFTEDGVQNFDLAAGVKVRATVTSAGASTSVSVWVF